MTAYHLLVALHLLAVVLWLGHMLFWSLFAGPALKKIAPAQTADTLRRLSLSMGGLGWPSLAVLVVTGYFLLPYRGIAVGQLFSGELFSLPWGTLIVAKLALVAWMVVYQSLFGHRAAPRAIYINMAAALAIIGLSVLLVRPALYL